MIKVFKENKFRSLFIISLVSFLFLIFSGIAIAAEKLTLNLDKCIELSLENNLGYQISESTVDLKEAKVEESEGAEKIKVKFKGGYIRMNEAPDPEAIAEGDFSYLFSTGQSIPQISVSMSKVIYSAGKFKSFVKQAEADRTISQNDLEQKAQELIYQVTQAYYGVLQTEGLKKVSEQAVTQIRAHLENSNALLAEGMIAPIDLNRIKSQLSNLEHNLIRAENGYDLAVYNLNSVMGIELDTPIELQNNLSYQPCEIVLPEALKTSITSRPELKNTQQQRIIAEQMVEIAESNKKPQIVMNLESGLAGWQVAIMGEIPIFDGGVNDAKIKQAEISLSQVDKGTQQVEQMIEFEVRSAYLRMKEAEKLIQVTQQGITNSMESFRIAQVKYKEGIATNTEVIDAQSALIEAETNHLGALYDYNTNRAALVKAMGIMGK